MEGKPDRWRQSCTATCRRATCAPLGRHSSWPSSRPLARGRQLSTPPLLPCFTHPRDDVSCARAVCSAAEQIGEPRRRAAAGRCSTSYSTVRCRWLQLGQHGASRRARPARPPRAADVRAGPRGHVAALPARADGRSGRPAASPGWAQCWGQRGPAGSRWRAAGELVYTCVCKSGTF